MKLSSLGEFGLIDRLTSDCGIDSDVICGIGDDCAVIRRGKVFELVTTDLLVERVHFQRDAITPGQLGQKAMAVNLSDIAAMGGSPRAAFVSIGIPRETDVELLDALYAGLKGMAQRFDTLILGGDTTGSKNDLVINVTVTGEVQPNELLLRNGAKPGDIIFVSGPLGDSSAGLHALLNNNGATELIRRHHEPIPHIEMGRAIAETGNAHAMIDVSDGLAQDLGHICERSYKGCLVDASRLPLSDELCAYCDEQSLDPLNFALGGGEDYVLCVTGDERLEGLGCIPIGEVTADTKRELLIDGAARPLEPTGWDHLR